MYFPLLLSVLIVFNIILVSRYIVKLIHLLLFKVSALPKRKDVAPHGVGHYRGVVGCGAQEARQDELVGEAGSGGV